MGTGQRPEPSGHAEQQAVGNRVQSVVPDRRTDGLGVGEIDVEADRGRQFDGIRHPCKKGVGTFVDRVDPREGPGPDATTHTVARLEDGDSQGAAVDAGDGKVVRRCQAADPGADDRDRRGVTIVTHLVIVEVPFDRSARTPMMGVAVKTTSLVVIQEEGQDGR